MRFLQELIRQDPIEEGSEYDSPIDNVIRAYALVAHANTLTGLHHHVPSDTVNYHLLKARMAYQRLLSAAHASQGRATAPDDTGDRATDIQELEEGFHDVLREADTINADQEEEDTDELEEARPAARDKQPKYVRLQGLPNVHAGLHIKDNIMEYATVMNCNVLAGELKHKSVSHV
jgi:hypothetical protein